MEEGEGKEGKMREWKEQRKEEREEGKEEGKEERREERREEGNERKEDGKETREEGKEEDTEAEVGMKGEEVCVVAMTTGGCLIRTGDSAGFGLEGPDLQTGPDSWWIQTCRLSWSSC